VIKAPELAQRTHPFEWAQFYSFNEVSFIPVEYKTKKPALATWKEYQSRRPTDDEMFAWFEQDSAKNIGVICGKVSGNLCVIDFDSMPAFQTALGNEWLKKTLVTKTSRGVHVWVRTPTPERVRHFKLKNSEGGVDVIGEGGFAISPPSVHESGARYELISETVDILKVDNLDFLNKLEFCEPKRVSLKNGVTEGQRNNSAFKLACRLRTDKFTMEEVVEKMLGWNAKNVPPIPNNELLNVIQSAFTYEGRVTGNYFKEGTFIPKMLADEILSELTIVSVNGRDMFYWDEILGYYKTAELQIRGMINARLGDENRRSRTEEVIFYINASRGKAEKDLEQPINLVALKNGILDLTSYEIEPLNPKFFFTGTLPVAYDPKAECPNIDEFLTDVVGEEAKQTFYELCGYTLYRSYPIQKAFMFVGSGSNGKSTTINLLRGFVGNENIANASLQSLSDSGNHFAASQLQYKLVNIYADLPARGLKDSGAFKMLTGGDCQNAEHKYRDPVPFINYAKLVFSANTVPETSDETDAFFRRWIIIPFNKRFEGETCDPRKGEKLSTPSELSGLFNKSLAALQRLLEKGAFSSSKTIDETKEAYIRASDPVGAFRIDQIEINADGWVSKEALYSAFVGYCQGNKIPAIDKGGFTRKLGGLVSIIEAQKTINGKKGVRGWSGISLVGLVGNQTEEAASSEQERLG